MPVRHVWIAVAILTAAVFAMPPLDALQSVPPGMCRVQGKITSGATALPGVSLVFHSGNAVAAATSTETDGAYQVVLKPGTYLLSAALGGFSPLERDLNVDGTACGQAIDFQLALVPRTARSAAAAANQADRGRSGTANGNQPFQSVAVQQQAAFSEVSATDVPVLVTGGFFRLAADRYYVPITVAIPGSAVTIPAGKDKATLDVMGMVSDEQGRPFGRIRQTMDLAAGAGAALESKQVLYQTAMTLPPGRFALKVVVRENVNGAIGSFETAVIIPELKQAPVKVSSVVLSTQLQPLPSKRRSDNPLVRDGMQIVPNVTHVVGRQQKLFFYFEVYEPVIADGAPEVRASLAFHRGKIKVLETPVVERAALDAPERKAALFRLEVPADAFKAGLYTCQINVIDAAAGTFAFPRLAMLVR